MSSHSNEINVPRFIIWGSIVYIIASHLPQYSSKQHGHIINVYNTGIFWSTWIVVLQCSSSSENIMKFTLVNEKMADYMMDIENEGTPVCLIFTQHYTGLPVVDYVLLDKYDDSV